MRWFPRVLLWLTRLKLMTIFTISFFFQVHASPNFKNLPKMVCEQHAITFNYNCNVSEIEPDFVIKNNPKSFDASKFTFKHQKVENVFARIVYKGIEYIEGMVLILNSMNGLTELPVFIKIICMGLSEGTIIFQTRELYTEYYDEDYSAYKVSDHNYQTLCEINLHSLEFKYPYNIWRPINDDKSQYISFQTEI